MTKPPKCCPTIKTPRHPSRSPSSHCRLDFSKMARSSFSSVRSYAEQLDQVYALKDLRSQFLIPTKADLKRKTLAKPKSEFLPSYLKSQHVD